MKFCAAVVAVYMAATATALPVSETEVTQKQYWGNPIVDHTPVPGTRRRDPVMHIIEKIPVQEHRGSPDEEDEAMTANGGEALPGDDETQGLNAGDQEGAQTVARRSRNRPVVDHRPSDRRQADASASVGAAASAGNTLTDKMFWGMPIIDHTPYPGKRQNPDEDT
ncbi:hypothetical protein PWT90_03600 [Aphanocladium album]|nr:hypothetical protein PWT90_03600 [Aphanocladium album]